MPESAVREGFKRTVYALLAVWVVGWGSLYAWHVYRVETLKQDAMDYIRESALLIDSGDLTPAERDGHLVGMGLQQGMHMNSGDQAFFTGLLGLPVILVLSGVAVWVYRGFRPHTPD